MSRSLVLHVGSHKTGTTTIQTELARNRTALSDANVFYCNAFPDFPGNHSVPIASIFGSDPADLAWHSRAGHSDSQIARFRADWEAALLQDIEQVTAGLYVISGEEIGTLDDAGMRGLGKFVVANFTDAVVVYCVREPAALLRSIEQQLLHSGNRRVDSLRPEALIHRYRGVPDRLIESFGRDRVQLYRMEDAQLEGITSYFVQRFLGVDIPTLENPRTKASMSQYAGTLLRLWGRYFPHGRPQSVGYRVAKTARAALARVPGPAYKLRVTIDTAASRRINVAAADLAREFALEPYAPLAPND